jgi:hypothetical protein
MSDRILTKLFEPMAALMDVEAAQKILTVKADRRTQARVAKLAQKCNNGELTPEERREYEEFIRVGDLVALFRAKALAVIATANRRKK